MKRNLLFLVFFLSMLSVSGQGQFETDVRTLASEEFGGRLGGTRGDTLTIDYILGELSKIDRVELWGNDGMQRFDIATKRLHISPRSVNELSISGEKLNLGSDFMPPVYSASGQYSMGVVFAGYGMNVKTDKVSRNDYRNIDVSGKWVLVLRESPDHSQRDYLSPSWDWAKVEEARRQGAAGVLLVHGKGDNWQLLESTELWNPQSDIPVVCITRAAANKILQGVATIEELETMSRQSAAIPKIECVKSVQANLSITRKRIATGNIIATIPGSDPILKDEFVVLGAHFDHVGRIVYKGQIQTVVGADDNATGVAAVLELARMVSRAKPMARSVMFVFFASEEEGLVGSKYFTRALPLPKGEVKHLVNFDMIGRYAKCDSVSFYGLGSFQRGDQIARSVPNSDTLRVKFEAKYSMLSDHVPFLNYNISASGLSTMYNPEVHTPLDNLDRIDFRGAERVVNYAFRYIQKLCDRKTQIVF